MKILHLERKFIKPTETFIANQINALAIDTKNFVFTTQHDEHLTVDAVVKVPPPRFLGSKLLRNSQKNYFVKEAERIEPNIIHAHFISDACLFHSFTKTLSIPKICSCYGYDVTEVPKKFSLIYKYFYDKVIAEYDYFLAMSEDMKLDLMKIGVPEKKIVIHYHGINTANFNLVRDYELRNGQLNLLTIASFREKKGHATILKALKIVSQRHPEIKFKYHIIGSGPLEKKLREMVRAYNLAERVVFHGLIKHGMALNEQLLLADIFLHPSVTTNTNDKEGIPGALVEAMASGLPVISTIHAGIPEVVINEKNGILIQERAASELATHLVVLYENAEKRKLLGTAAATYANSNLDYLVKANALKAIYNDLINRA